MQDTSGGCLGPIHKKGFSKKPTEQTEQSKSTDNGIILADSNTTHTHDNSKIPNKQK